MCNVARRSATNFENSVFQFAERINDSSFAAKRFSGFVMRFMILGRIARLDFVSDSMVSNGQDAIRREELIPEW